MFRKMRRFRQALPEAAVRDILLARTNGVLALSGDDGYPYAVPVSYVYDPDENCIFFHGAKEGHKIDAIHRNEKASFCVVDKDEIVPKEFTSYFRSVIVFGKIRIVEDEEEKRRSIDKLARKYSPDETDASRGAEIEKEWRALCMLRLDIENMTGKEAIELTGQRQEN